jgi:hypothetical protein
MSDNSVECRENAVRCRNMADAAESEDMKANWLLLYGGDALRAYDQFSEQQKSK